MKDDPDVKGKPLTLQDVVFVVVVQVSTTEGIVPFAEMTLVGLALYVFITGATAAEFTVTVILTVPAIPQFTE